MSEFERESGDEILFATGRLVGEDDQLLQDAAERIARGEPVDLDALRERPTLSEDDLSGIGELAAPLDDAFIGALTSFSAVEADNGEAPQSSAGIGPSATELESKEAEGAQVISLASRRPRKGWIAGTLSAAAAAAAFWWAGGGGSGAPADAGLYRLELANAPAVVRGSDVGRDLVPAPTLKLESDANVQWILRPAQAVSGPVRFTAELMEEGTPRLLAEPCVSHDASSSGVVRVDLRLGACDWGAPGGERELRLTVSLSQEQGAGEPAQAFPVRLTLVEPP